MQNENDVVYIYICDYLYADIHIPMRVCMCAYIDICIARVWLIWMSSSHKNREQKTQKFNNNFNIKNSFVSKKNQKKKTNKTKVISKRNKK